MIKLGQELRDKVTGFVGTAIVEVEYLFGCTQFGIVPPMNEEGEIKNSEFFDVGRLEIISEGVASKDGIPNWGNDIQLGNEARDIVTGYNGVVVGRARYFYGDVRYGIAPKVKNNVEMKDHEYFTEKRVRVTGRGIAPEEVQADKKGGISREMPRCIR